MTCQGRRMVKSTEQKTLRTSGKDLPSGADKTPVTNATRIQPTIIVEGMILQRFFEQCRDEINF